MLSHKISEIDLPTILEGEGVPLRRYGNNYQCQCWRHDDKHPSMSVYYKDGKWRFHCFGCGASGDVLDAIRQLHGLDFKGALSYLGISNTPPTPAQKAKIKKNKTRRNITDTFKKWELAAIGELRGMIFTAYRISSQWRTVEDFERGCMILDPLADLQGQLDTLMMGSLEDRVAIYHRWAANGYRY